MEEASTEADSRGEYDKGAFDAVTRATANHGMHRGSFVQDAYILGENGKEYKVAKWTDANNAVLADGRTLTKNTNRDTKETTLSIGDETTKYVKTELKGIKYVPVAVDAADFHSFCENRSVYGNGSTLAGGYSENNLKAYSETAYVDSTTNGLKEATLNGTTWSFGARQTGSGSGILNKELQTASTITTTPKENVGSYGEKIRVDLTGDDYGALGSQMQTVKWTYYGNDSTYTNAVASYGTKFAADNWMHRMMGIQLGLTDSIRFQLPSGYKGTGYWKITVYALGYEDYSTTFELTAANVAGVSEPMSEEQKKQLTALKDEAKELLDAHGTDYSEASWKALKEHYDEAVTLLAKADATSAEAEELLGELPALIAAVKPQTTEKTGEAEVKGYGYKAKVKVTVDSKGKIVSVTDNGTTEGSNTYWWNLAKGMFENFTGKTADNVDSVDAISGATVASNAIKSAVKSALGTTATTLEAPTISAADLRTEPVFAADEDAAFTVTGEEGSTTYDISRVYANGHSVTVKDTITYKKSWLGRKIYAGRTEDCTADNCVITVEKGDLEIYAGNFSGTFNGDVTVNVSGTDEQTTVDLNGPSGTINGNVTFNIIGGEEKVYISGFLGELAGGNISGTLTLNITGKPKLSNSGAYKASVDKETFGVLDFTGADSEFVSANKDKFTKFAEIKGGASTAADTAEILSLEEATDEEKEVYGPVVLPIYNEETPVAGIEFYFDELNSEETDEFFEKTEDKAEIKDNLTEK